MDGLRGLGARVVSLGDLFRNSFSLAAALLPPSEGLQVPLCAPGSALRMTDVLGHHLLLIGGIHHHGVQHNI